MGRIFFGILVLAGLLWGCAGALPVSREGALPQTPLADLISNVNGYLGQTVVMGGFVLEVENQQHATRILAVQVPLDSGQRLKSKDLSEGRLVLIYDGFIDPEVYTKGRGITVGGEIIGGTTNDPEVPYPYLKIKVRDIHLWSEAELSESKRYYEYDPFFPYHYPYIYPWYRGYPYWPYPYYYHPYRGPYPYDE